LWGRGPGASEQKLLYLPDAHTDFAFAILGEELGLIGATSVVLAFTILFIVGFRIALCSNDFFGTLLASGIVSLLAFQSAFNMAMTTGLVPTKGLPLPFISFGGSSLLINMGLMGILVSIGLQAREPAPAPKTKPKQRRFGTATAT
jgi:cell division protein FtsW